MDPNEEQFFQQGEERSELTLEPPEDLPHAPETTETSAVVDADVHARRARLRRVVGAALLGGLALFAIGLLRHFGGPLFELGGGEAARQATLSALLPAKSPSAVLPPAMAIASTSVALAADSDVPSAAPSNDRVAAVETESLIRTARTLLEGGHLRDGIAAARNAVNANPRNAEPYILLAAGLQDLGKWAEAQTVFATCKDATSRGPNATCRYFASAGTGK